jgi:hypothetical protein
MPGLRVRHDGWTEARTGRFLDTLAVTGCVRDAARVAGLSSHSGYRQYKRFPAFAAAWDDALARAQVGLVAIAYKRAVEGKETVIIRKGEEVERRISPSDSILAMLVKRGDLTGEAGKVSAEERAQLMSATEYDAGMRFDGWGKKIETDANGAEQRFHAKMALMRERINAAAAAAGACPTCGHPLCPDTFEDMSLAELHAIGMITDEDIDDAWRGD